MTRALQFHLRHAWFNTREQFSDLGSGIAGFLLFPFYIFLVGRLWGRFNAYQGHYTLMQVMLYVGTTEIWFMTFLRPTSLSRAAGDFSISLARPRSWLAMSFSGLFGRCFGSRLVYTAIFLVVMPLMGARVGETGLVTLRCLLCLPILGLVQALIGLLFASAEVLWTETSYFILPVSKIFLALGGVFGPLIDFAEPWRTILLRLPPSDFFFQPAQFCVKGTFYAMTPSEWVGRVLRWCAVLVFTNLVFFAVARRHHKAYGG